MRDLVRSTLDGGPPLFVISARLGVYPGLARSSMIRWKWVLVCCVWPLNYCYSASTWEGVAFWNTRVSKVDEGHAVPIDLDA